MCVAAMGLGVLQIFFYSPANAYGVPISGISDISLQTKVNNTITMDDWASAWDYGMEDDFCELPYYVVTDSTDGSKFTSKLLDHASEKDFMHYYGFAVDTNGDWSVRFNVSAYHSLPISMNVIRNSIGKTKFDSHASISITSHPLPTTEDALNGFIFGLMASLYLLLPFAFGAVYQLVMDKTTLTKHQQLVSGMRLFSYRIGNYIADILILLVLIAPTVTILIQFCCEIFGCFCTLFYCLLCLFNIIHPCTTTCYKILCGRCANKHMLHHYKEETNGEQCIAMLMNEFILVF